MLASYDESVYVNWYRNYYFIGIGRVLISVASASAGSGTESGFDSFPFSSAILEPDFDLNYQHEKRIVIGF